MDNSIGNMKTMVNDSGKGGYTLSPGDTLGQYRIVRPLGKGGMGEVYLAEHAILTTRHAVKLLPAERSDAAGFLDRFHDEARVMARLKHAGIVHVTHADAQEGRHYLVMDFVGAEGADEPFDLEEALAEAPDNRLPPDVVARLGMQIAEAVGSAHQKGVVHRDLKPANVLLTSRDLKKASARVTDFGLARLLGEDWVRSVIDVSVRQSMSIGGAPTMMKAREERSSTGSILGTYEYMSPEQRDGAEVDERSDIYALGVMLYRMVTGKKLMGLAKPPSRLVKGLDPAWDDVIVSCLEEEPADRPQDMGMIASSLDSLCRKALSQRKEQESQRLQEAEERRRAEERPREEEARLKRNTQEAARKREQEQQRRAEEAAKGPEPAPPLAKKKSGGGTKWVVGLLVLAGVIGYGVWQGSQGTGTAGGRRPSQLSAQPVVQPPRTQPAATAQPAAPATQRPVAPSGERDPVAGSNWTSPATGMEFVWIAQMNMWVGKFEVTNGEYRKKEPRHDSKSFNNHSLNGDRQPVVQVNFDDAKAYAVWLTERDKAQLGGMRYRVPSEQEFQTYAQCGDGREYPWGNNWPPRSGQAGNYHGQEGAGSWNKISGYNDGHPVTCNVEQSWANPWGVYGVGGNVWEVCAKDTSGGSFGAWRGASWYSSTQAYLRCAYRLDRDGSSRYNSYGFRLVLSR